MFWSGMRNAPRLVAQFFLGGLRSKIKSNLKMQYTAHYLSHSTGVTSGLPTSMASLLIKLQS